MFVIHENDSLLIQYSWRQWQFYERDKNTFISMQVFGKLGNCFLGVYHNISTLTRLFSKFISTHGE